MSAFRLISMLGALLLVVAVVAGCGGDSGSDSAGAGGDAGQGSGDQASATAEGEDGDGESGGEGEQASASKKEFVKKASAACRKEREKLLPKVDVYMKQQKAQGVPEEVAIAKLAKEIFAPTVEAEIAAIRRIGPPEGEEEEVEELLANEEEVLDEVTDMKRVKSFEALIEPFFEVSQEFLKYGFTSCTN